MFRALNELVREAKAKGSTFEEIDDLSKRWCEMADLKRYPEVLEPTVVRTERHETSRVFVESQDRGHREGGAVRYVRVWLCMWAFRSEAISSARVAMLK